MSSISSGSGPSRRTGGSRSCAWTGSRKGARDVFFRERDAPRSSCRSEALLGGDLMGKVLVVEDNRANMKLATFLLESAGHTVISATDAEAGLALARTEQPGLILMDIQLPDMDGLEATMLLKADPATRAIPVIALTALAMKGDEERIRAAGCDGYIAKPMRYREFLAAVTNHLGTP